MTTTTTFDDHVKRMRACWKQVGVLQVAAEDVVAAEATSVVSLGAAIRRLHKALDKLAATMADVFVVGPVTSSVRQAKINRAVPTDVVAAVESAVAAAAITAPAKREDAKKAKRARTKSPKKASPKKAKPNLKKRPGKAKAAKRKPSKRRR